MRRRIFTFIAAASAAIFLLSTIIWLCGFFASDDWASNLYTPSSHSLDTHCIVTSNGWLFSVRYTTLLRPGSAPEWPHPLDSSWVHETRPPNVPPSLPRSMNDSLFTWYSEKPAPRPKGSSILISAYAVTGVRLLLVIALSSLLPALWIFRHIRNRRASKAGCCPTCGYDLRASPQRCPECGTIRKNAAEISN
jgi:hypothetical protein